MDENNDIKVESNSYQIESNSINSTSFSFFNKSYNTNTLSMDTLQEYVKYPMIYSAVLREISRQSYNKNGIYGSAINSIVSLPTLSYVTTLRNNKDVYKNKKKTFNTILKLLNHDRVTRDFIRHSLIDGMYCGILRDTTASNKNITPMSGMIEGLDRIEGLSLDDNFMIQSLDLDYVKALGTQNGITIMGFDLTYFQQFTHGGLINEIKNFPHEFLTAYLAYKKDASKRWFILDSRKTIAYKFRADEDEAYGRPYGLQALADIKFSEDYNNNQYKIVEELASSIYYLILPEGDKAGACSLNRVQQQEVIDAFKNAVKLNTSGGGARISTLSLPPNTKLDRLTKDSSLLKDTLSNENLNKISTAIGFAASALNAESSGSSSYSNLQVNLSLITAELFQIVNECARELTRVINEYLNITPANYIDINYLPITYLNKDDVYEKAKDLFMTAGGSRMYYIASAGFDPNSYLMTCDEEREENLDDKYLPHITSYTASDNADNANADGNLGGRPKVKEKELSPQGQQTRNLNSNKNKKPSTDKG